MSAIQLDISSEKQRILPMPPLSPFLNFVVTYLPVEIPILIAGVIGISASKRYFHKTLDSWRMTRGGIPPLDAPKDSTKAFDN